VLDNPEGGELDPATDDHRPVAQLGGGGYSPPIGPKKKYEKRAFNALTRFVCSDMGI